ncbi:alpha/beta hydrolase [Dickeya zeae]|uniref:alpha/beta hydrolase n=1 Tax=Dickeya zeae TaxID=204042 RepID=UPI00143FC5DB|nr:alpha/beta hydrolase [Dickeya zeae]QIZ45404.1 alpha/beta hydrolase [Dickeya zeae]
MLFKKIVLAGAIIMGMTATTIYAATPDLPGYTDGALVIQVKKTSEQIDAMSGIIYSQVKSTRAIRQLRMSLLIPRSQDLKPAIVYFPGGGFTSADYEKFSEMRMALAEAGFVVAAAEYRVVPDTFPAPVQDGKSAVRFLREHAAEYGIDPNRIGVLGDSAGGYLAQMLGTTNGDKQFEQGQFLNQSSDVQAVVTLYGLSNLLNIGEGFPENVQKVHQSPAVTEALLVNGTAFRDWPGATISSDPKKALNASPMGHIKGKKPPFLIMHGSKDTLVSPMQSAQLFKALKAEGNRVDYVLVEGANHGDITWFQKPIIERVVNWFKQTLGDPTKSATSSTKASANANL